MQLLFVRHGQTDNNAKRLIQGKSDTPLNETGRAQAESIAQVLKREHFSAIISSPLQRAYQTAEIIAREVGLPIEVDDRLMERDFGLLQDQTYDLLSIHPETGRPDFFCDAYQEYQVEPIYGMISRVSDFLKDLSHREEPSVLVVAHGGIGYLFDQILAESESPQVVDNGQIQHYSLARKKDDMSIAFYLTLKSEVVFENPDATVRQLMERLDHHHLTAIPILDFDGRYIGTVTEGDILRRIRMLDGGKGIRDLEKLKVTDLERSKEYQPVRIDANIRDLLYIVEHQNFVPVVDDQGVFIGIIKRSDVIHRLADVIHQSTLPE